jgi:hypothetical protein
MKNKIVPFCFPEYKVPFKKNSFFCSLPHLDFLSTSTTDGPPKVPERKSSLERSKTVLTSLDQTKPVSTSLDKPKPVLTSLDKSKPHLTSLDKSKPVLTGFKLKSSNAKEEITSPVLTCFKLKSSNEEISKPVQNRLFSFKPEKKEDKNPVITSSNLVKPGVKTDQNRLASFRPAAKEDQLDKKNKKDPVQSGSNPVQSGSNPVQSGSNPVQSGSNPVQSGLKLVQSGSNPSKSSTDTTQSGSNQNSKVEIQENKSTNSFHFPKKEANSSETKPVQTGYKTGFTIVTATESKSKIPERLTGFIPHIPPPPPARF